MTHRRIAFVWDNFGPLHGDRCNAVARHFGDQIHVRGVEIFARSFLYDWQPPAGLAFEKITLFETGSWQDHSHREIARSIVSAVKDSGCTAAFLSHYNERATLLAATLLKRSGVELFTMGCSKYDDAPRSFWRERAKRVFYWPYAGGIGSEVRSTAYMRFLGLPPDRVFGGYNTVDQDRIRRLAHTADNEPIEFASRPFLAVARLVWEKNYPGMLRAYAAYAAKSEKPRRLQIAGSGPLEDELKALAAQLSIDRQIDWLGFVQTEAVAPLMRGALCLLLPSISETFGNVVPEALALDLPVLASTQCGATDQLVQDGVSGFTFRANDESLLVSLMRRVGGDETLWLALRQGARELAPLGHTDVFARSVAQLING